jgi:hypothetical protein
MNDNPSEFHELITDSTPSDINYRYRQLPDDQLTHAELLKEMGRVRSTLNRIYGERDALQDIIDHRDMGESNIIL